MKVELRMIHYTTIVLPGKPLTNDLIMECFENHTWSCLGFLCTRALSQIFVNVSVMKFWNNPDVLNNKWPIRVFLFAWLVLFLLIT